VVDFTLTDEQKSMREMAHDFAEKEIRPVAPHYDETEEFPWDVLKKAAEVGLYSIDVYMQAAQDPSGLTLPLITEELFWGCAGIGLALTGTGLPLMSLWNTGTPEQLAAWAPRMIGTPEAPQVAAFADAQVVVEKREQGKRTVASAQTVTGEERVRELSRMLAGVGESAHARSHAAELLEAGHTFKQARTRGSA